MLRPVFERVSVEEAAASGSLAAEGLCHYSLLANKRTYRTSSCGKGQRLLRFVTLVFPVQLSSYDFHTETLNSWAVYTASRNWAHYRTVIAMHIIINAGHVRRILTEFLGVPRHVEANSIKKIATNETGQKMIASF